MRWKLAVGAMALGFVASGLAGAVTPALPRNKAPADAKVFIVSPADGATVDEDFEVVFGASGVAIVPAGDHRPDSGHHHLLIDVDELPPLALPIPGDARHVHFGKGQTSTELHLAPGTHTLQLDLGDALHMQFDPPVVSPRITVHVVAKPAP